MGSLLPAILRATAAARPPPSGRDCARASPPQPGAPARPSRTIRTPSPPEPDMRASMQPAVVARSSTMPPMAGRSLTAGGSRVVARLGQPQAQLRRPRQGVRQFRQGIVVMGAQPTEHIRRHHRHERIDQHDEEVGKLRQRREDFAHATREERAGQEACRHIGTKACGEVGQLAQGERFARHAMEDAQGRRRIRRAAPDARGHRQVLGQPEPQAPRGALSGQRCRKAATARITRLVGPAPSP
jgi:hypothetical protein